MFEITPLLVLTERVVCTCGAGGIATHRAPDNKLWCTDCLAAFPTCWREVSTPEELKIKIDIDKEIENETLFS